MNTPDEKEFTESVQVVSGSPTAKELAAVIAVLQEVSKQQSSAALPQRSTWAKNEQILRTGLVTGNGQWGSTYKQGL
ncbi:MAG: acyl-CoA carboxylase subunit epsilon [Rhodoluna sp.]